MTIKEKIKSYRTKKGLTQPKLGEMVGVTQQYISSLELGSYTPSYDLAVKLAKIFECDVDELIVNETSKEDSFTIMLVKQLLAEGIIKDGELNKNTVDMIITAVKVDIERIQKSSK